MITNSKSLTQLTLPGGQPQDCGLFQAFAWSTVAFTHNVTDQLVSVTEHERTPKVCAALRLSRILRAWLSLTPSGYGIPYLSTAQIQRSPIYVFNTTRQGGQSRNDLRVEVVRSSQPEIIHINICIYANYLKNFVSAMQTQLCHWLIRIA